MSKQEFSFPAEAEVIAYMETLSNWGRWGEDDRVGTLNHITDEVRVAAAAMIRTGKAVSLSRDIDPLEADPLHSGIAQVQRFMGLHEVADHLGGEQRRFDAVTEYVGISAHGSNTHIDGLAHYSWEGTNYNGFKESDTTSLFGAKSSPYTRPTAASSPAAFCWTSPPCTTCDGWSAVTRSPRTNWRRPSAGRA